MPIPKRLADEQKMNMGFFGNIWVRQRGPFNIGHTEKGHSHYFDHISFLTQGAVRVTVEGYPPKVFTAPDFICIRKELHHMIEPLEDNSIWYCCFAMRDEEGVPLCGNGMTEMFSEDNDPMPHNYDNRSAAAVKDTYWRDFERRSHTKEKPEE